MKHEIKKIFWDYEKEEKWLNEMASKGLALIGYSWGKYVFEDAPKSWYAYRLLMLENPFDHPESQKYLEFLEETGIEYVTHYMKWVYLRKKTDDGEFVLYSDIDSKLKHFRTVYLYWIAFVWIEMSTGLINIFFSLMFFLLEGRSSINYIIGIPLIVMGFVFMGISIPLKRKISRLKKEKAIME